MDFRSHPLNPLTVAGVGGAVIAGLIGAAVHPPSVLGPRSSPSTVFCPSGPDQLEVVVGTCPSGPSGPTDPSGTGGLDGTRGTGGTEGPAGPGTPTATGSLGPDHGRSNPVIIIVSRRPEPQDDQRPGATEDPGQNSNNHQDDNHQDDGNGQADGQDEAAGPRVACPDVESQLPAVPDGAAAEVAEQLADLREQITDADARLAGLAADPVDDPGFVENTVLGPLRDRRAATLDRITIAIGRHTTRPTGLGDLAACTLAGQG